MPTINQLSSTSSLTTSDKMVVYSNDNGDSRKATLATLISFLHDNFQEPGLVTQIVVPTASPQTVTLNASTQNIWLVLNPAATFGQVTVAMPPSATAFDGQEVSVSTSQTITTFGITGNGASVAGSPGTLAAGGFVTFKYNVTVNTWYATNVGNISSFGTIQVSTSINDGSNNEVIKIGSTASAVNEVTITNAANGFDPVIEATGASSNIDLALSGKGSGNVKAYDSVNALYYDVVTTGKTQTLSAKTLSSPTINTPTITSPTVTGTATVGAVTLGGNISVDVTNTRSIGSSAASRLNKVWTQFLDVTQIDCSDVIASGGIAAASAGTTGNLTSQTKVKSPLLVGYSTTTDPPDDTVGALTQRNATVASCRYSTSSGLLTKRYNVNTISESGPSGGNYIVTLNDAVSTDSSVIVTLGSNSTTSSKFFAITTAVMSSTTQIAIDTAEIDLVANTVTTKSASFSLVIIGSPATDRTL